MHNRRSPHHRRNPRQNACRHHVPKERLHLVQMPAVVVLRSWNKNGQKGVRYSLTNILRSCTIPTQQGSKLIEMHNSRRCVVVDTSRVMEMEESEGWWFGLVALVAMKKPNWQGSAKKGTTEWRMKTEWENRKYNHKLTRSLLTTLASRFCSYPFSFLSSTCVHKQTNIWRPTWHQPTPFPIRILS